MENAKQNWAIVASLLALIILSVVEIILQLPELKQDKAARREMDFAYLLAAKLDEQERKANALLKDGKPQEYAVLTAEITAARQLLIPATESDRGGGPSIQEQAALSSFVRAGQGDCCLNFLKMKYPQWQPDSSAPEESSAMAFAANLQRWTEIVNKSQSVKRGMSTREVKQLLGPFDRVQVLYEPKVKDARRIGTTWFYLRKPSEEVSQSKSVIAVRFDLEDTVTAVDSWGMEE